MGCLVGAVWLQEETIAIEAGKVPGGVTADHEAVRYLLGSGAADF